MSEFVQWPGKKAGIGWLVTDAGCHLWCGTKDHNGYGRVWLGGAMRQVHRVRYEREVGPVPAGLHLDHFACDTKACCNPAHVRPVTQRENNLRADGVAAVHAAKTHCPKGHPLTEDNLVRSLWKKKRYRQCLTCTRERDAKFSKGRKRKWADR